MKLSVYIEVDASKTAIQCLKKHGFTVTADGPNMRLSIAEYGNVPQRKAKVVIDSKSQISKMMENGDV